MFQKLSEWVTIWGIQRKILQIEKRKIYEYGIEVILLNGSILCISFLIALLRGRLPFFLAFLLFFVPLRMSVGGKHASKSEVCFVCSILMYCLLQRISSLKVEMKPAWLWLIGMLLLMLFLWFVAPVQSRKRLYIKEQAQRNRTRAHFIIMIDFTVFCIFCEWIPRIAYYQFILIFAVALLALWGAVETARKM